MTFLLQVKASEYSLGPFFSFPGVEGLFCLGSEGFQSVFMSFQSWSANQIDAIRYRGHHGIEALFDRLGLSGEVHYQAFFSNACRLSAQDCGGNLFQ